MFLITGNRIQMSKLRGQNILFARGEQYPGRQRTVKQPLRWEAGSEVIKKLPNRPLAEREIDQLALFSFAWLVEVDIVRPHEDECSLPKQLCPAVDRVKNLSLHDHKQFVEIVRVDRRDVPELF